jgi:hypothetical protein
MMWHMNECPRSYSWLSSPSRQGKASPRLQVTLAQLSSCRFSNNEVYINSDPRIRGEGYRVASEALLNVRDINMVTIQTCILLGAYAAADGDTDVENMYYTLAGRMSLTLDLPNRPVMSLLEREINIRGT